MSQSILEVEEVNEDDIEQILKINEFFLFQERVIYTIVITEYLEYIIIKYKKYEKILRLDTINSLFKNGFNSLHECFEYISQLFEENKVHIKSINVNRTIKLSFNINNNANTNNVDIDLVYDKEQSNCLMEELNNKYNKLNKNYNALKKELKSMENEQKKIKLIQNNENPKTIKFSKDIVTDSFAGFSYDDSFTVFRSINDILLIVYATKNKSIFCYDLEKKAIIHKLFNTHNNYITNFRHFLDEDNRRDIIMSISKKITILNYGM